MNLNLPIATAEVHPAHGKAAQPAERAALNLFWLPRRLGQGEAAASPYQKHPQLLTTASIASRRRGAEGVALVITLLLLSVITFLAIAFLAMSRQNKAAVSASLDVATARAAADAALARAQAEISAAMLAHGDALYYDYMVSRNYESPAFTNGNKNLDVNNVNYDFLAKTTTRFSSANNPTGWAQNIANLWYDPRPPVFVVTNPALPNNYDFRFYVDIDRNGKFETNGDQPLMNDFGQTLGSNAVMNGEPEWIGQLRNPLYHHSGTNSFINRYAYLVLPIGKTLDLNYIGNFLKQTYLDGFSALQPGVGPPIIPSIDGYARDQGIGSWELNLAGLSEAVSPWAYEEPSSFTYPGYPIPSFGLYNYAPPNGSKSGFNTGNAFEDAQAIIAFRYGSPLDAPVSLKKYFFLTNYLDVVNNDIDAYCVDAPMSAPFDYNHTNVQQPVTGPWAGSYSTNMIYDPQDLFDVSKVGGFLPARLLVASQRTNTFDRYTFLRLLSSAGIGSSPEYGVWVYGDSTNIVPPLVLRTKINLNYDNTAQITNVNAPYVLAPTLLEPWNPTTFFNNAAELLLRSKIFTFSNMVGTSLIGTTFTQTFGVTNIPIYRTNNPGIGYDEGIHRMLQVAANIYDATQPTPSSLSGSTVRHPTIFRPRFGFVGSGTNLGINIIGYVQVTNATLAYKQILSHGGFKDLSVAAQDSPATLLDDNIWGIPWIVSAEKGLPQFNQYSYNSRVLFTRKLLFVRQGTLTAPVTNKPPQYTNQFYCMAISNSLGMDAWNAYPSNFTGSAGYTSCYISNYITIQVTNNYNYGFTTNLVNYRLPNGPQGTFTWTPCTSLSGQSPGAKANGFITFLSTNITSMQACYFSEANRNLVFFTNGIISSNGFLPADMKQAGWPVHNWTLNITNHLVYVLFDGSITDGSVLDFVNLGPFGTSLSLNPTAENENAGLANQGGVDYWSAGSATDLAGSPMSLGMINQIMNNNIRNASTNVPYVNALLGASNSLSSWTFGAPYDPANSSEQLSTWVANDPLVHYTADDLYWPGHTPAQSTPAAENLLLTNSLGTISARYSPWGAQDVVGNNMLFKDPLMFSSTNGSFPTNKFPGVGWIGRVHRGTPWQTIYLKSDSPESLTSQNLWTSAWVKSPETYPTNDWSIVDAFTTAPNDNAARGLLAVNQTNDAAWAAVFAGVIAPTNALGGVPISPIAGVQYLMDSQYGINNQRTNHPNGIFHKVGDILAASALTTNSPYLLGNPANYSDEIIERIPQQTLSLLKVGEPQFVIFAWGQSLKPKGAPYLVSGPNFGMYTNYEITGECLTRTVCHFVHTNGLKMVVDSYNVESANP